MIFMGGNFTEQDNEVVRGVIRRLNENFNLDEKLDELTPEERYVYMGICTGVNTFVTMAEHNLQEDSAEVLNRILNCDLFSWDDGESNTIEDEIINDPELLENVLAEAVISSAIEDIEKN